MQTERRKYPRKRVGPNTAVVCTSAEANVPAAVRNNLALKVVDVGGKGACIVTVGRLRETLPVFIEIALPDVHERFRARAVIRWSQTLRHKGREAHVAGVEFLEILEASGEQVQFLAQGLRKPRALKGEDLRREHGRLHLQQARVTCRPRGLLSALGFSGEIAAQLAGLTPDGFNMICGNKLTEGQRLDVRLDFQNPSAFVAGTVEVRSCRRDTLVLEPRYTVEAVFTELLPENRERLEGIRRFLER